MRTSRRAVANTKAGSSGLHHYGALVAMFLLGAVSAIAGEALVVDVVAAEPAFDQRTGQPLVTFKMTDASARQFGGLTQRNVGRKMEIRVDGQALSAPVVREPIVGGTGQISGSLTAEQARELAQRLAAGTARIEFVIADD